MSTHWPSADAGGHEHRHEPWCPDSVLDSARVPSDPTASLTRGWACLPTLAILWDFALWDFVGVCALPSPAEAEAEAAAASSATILAAAAFLAAPVASFSFVARCIAPPAPTPPRIVCHIVRRSPVVHGCASGVTAAFNIFHSVRSVATSSTVPLKTPEAYGSFGEFAGIFEPSFG